MAIIGYIYIVGGSPFIKPFVASSVSEAYRYVKLIKPIKNKLDCTEKELNLIFKGTKEHFHILVNQKYKKENVLIYLYKTSHNKNLKLTAKENKALFEKSIKLQNDNTILIDIEKNFSDKNKNNKEEILLKSKESRQKTKTISEYSVIVSQLAKHFKVTKDELFSDLKFVLKHPTEVKKSSDISKRLSEIYKRLKKFKIKERNILYWETDRWDAMDMWARVQRIRREQMYKK